MTITTFTSLSNLQTYRDAKLAESLQWLAEDSNYIKLGLKDNIIAYRDDLQQLEDRANKVGIQTVSLTEPVQLGSDVIPGTIPPPIT